MKSICVFCGSAKGINPVFVETARQVGRFLAEKDLQLVYGAGNVGLMGELADAALSAGGKVLGVIPGFLKMEEVCHEGLTELIVTDTMHQRKWIMEERSDAVVILPGGFGTLDEFFEILTWKQLKLHHKPIGIFNVNGFYDPLLAHVRNMTAEGFLHESNLNLFCVAETMADLFIEMKKEANQKGNKWL